MPEKHGIESLNEHKTGTQGKLPLADFEEPIIIGSGSAEVHVTRKLSKDPDAPKRVNSHYHLGDASIHRPEAVEKELHEIEKHWEEFDQEN